MIFRSFSGIHFYWTNRTERWHNWSGTSKDGDVDRRERRLARVTWEPCAKSKSRSPRQSFQNRRILSPFPPGKRKRNQKAPTVCQIRHCFEEIGKKGSSIRKGELENPKRGWVLRTQNRKRLWPFDQWVPILGVAEEPKAYATDCFCSTGRCVYHLHHDAGGDMNFSTKFVGKNFDGNCLMNYFY